MDTNAVIDNIRRRLKHLTRGQLETRVGDKAPTIAELLSLLTNDGSPILTIEAPLDEKQLYHLGQLVVILDLLATREKRPALVRWFD